MDFWEKLQRRASEVNKAKRSRDVGLHPNAISSYINKRSMPRADIARKISQALEVPLDWMLDESQAWPPPSANIQGQSIVNTPTNDLVRELARRLRLEQLESGAALKDMESINWPSVAKSLASKSKPMSPKAAAAIAKIAAFSRVYSAVTLHEHLLVSADLLHDDLPGPDKPTASNLRADLHTRIERLSRDEGYRKAFAFAYDQWREVGFDFMNVFGANRALEIFENAKDAEKSD